MPPKAAALAALPVQPSPLRKPSWSIPLEAHRRYEIPDAACLLSQSVAKTWSDIKLGKLRVLKDGGRTYVPGAEIIRASTLPTA